MLLLGNQHLGRCDLQLRPIKSREACELAPKLSATAKRVDYYELEGARVLDDKAEFRRSNEIIPMGIHNSSQT